MVFLYSILDGRALVEDIAPDSVAAEYVSLLSVISHSLMSKVFPSVDNCLIFTFTFSSAGNLRLACP